MKKADKMALLARAKGTYDLIRCHLKYENYWYYYILDCSDKLMLATEEFDFTLNGFAVRKISDIKKLEVKNDLCPRINRENGILSGVIKPEVDLTSWKTCMESLERMGHFLIVEGNGEDGERFFYIGRIEKVKRSSVLFSWFDAEGIWQEAEELRYSKITNVIFGSRYCTGWESYMTRNGRESDRAVRFEDLMGKTLLVGVTYNTHGGKFIEQKQYWGTVTRADEKSGIVIRRQNGELFSLPPDLSSTQWARPGEYRLRSTGEVVTDPDFTATWTKNRGKDE